MGWPAAVGLGMSGVRAAFFIAEVLPQDPPSVIAAISSTETSCSKTFFLCIYSALSFFSPFLGSIVWRCFGLLKIQHHLPFCFVIGFGAGG